jgi:hypothetical protein
MQISKPRAMRTRRIGNLENARFVISYCGVCGAAALKAGVAIIPSPNARYRKLWRDLRLAYNTRAVELRQRRCHAVPYSVPRPGALCKERSAMNQLSIFDDLRAMDIHTLPTSLVSVPS